MSEYVINPDPDRMTVRAKRTQYDELAGALAEGKSIFIRNMGRQKASYAAKRMSATIKKPVDHWPVTYNGMDGYHFKAKSKKRR